MHSKKLKLHGTNTHVSQEVMKNHKNRTGFSEFIILFTTGKIKSKREFN